MAPVAMQTAVNAQRECPTTLSDTAEELLKFRLYQDDEGIWVCCDFCNKWRYVAEQKDPAVFIKRNFHCKDVKKKCNVGVEGESNHEFYETKVCAGSLVWAKRPDIRKAKDWPWWPALVEDSPDSASQYFLLDPSGNGPIAYHVTYLDAYRTRGWVASNLIKPFELEKESNRRPSTRAGKKQRILSEAIERAKNAAAFGVVDRLEMFSYIAHLARLKGLILPCKRPTDKILNTAEPSHENLSENSAGTAAHPAKATGFKRRPRKRKLETSGSEIHATNGAGTAQASPVKEPAGEEYVEISSKLSPRVDVDSGYAVDDESSIDPAIDIVAKKKPRKKGLSVRKEESDSFDLSGSSPLSQEIERSQPGRRKADKARERVPTKSEGRKVVTPKGPESVKTPRKKKAKKDDLQSQSSTSEPREKPKSRTSKPKRTLSGDQLVASPPQNPTEEDVAQPKNTLKDVGLGVAESEIPIFVQDSGVESVGDMSSPIGPKSDQTSKRNDDDLESSNTLESTENLKVVRRRRSKDAPDEENKTPKTAIFTQPVRRDNPTRAVALSERRDPIATTGLSSSMSQPLPGSARRRFAPPTRPKVRDGDYMFEDLKRDVDEGVI